jgi:hypothetical protein
MSMPKLNEQKESVQMERLSSAEELATARFGSVEGLAIVYDTTLELANFYAKRYELDASDPEVTLNATALAFARHKEFMLLRQVERDLYNRILTSHEKTDYGEVLFNATRAGLYKEVYREIDRLHSRAALYLKELRELAALNRDA